MAAQREALHDLWRDARTDATGTDEALGRLLRRFTAQVLERLYPGCVPGALLAG
jgi:hypothetical protein